MALEYKIEWIIDEKRSFKESAFIHLTKELPCFQARISKEAYTLAKCKTDAILEEDPEAFDAEAQCSQICELVDKLFAIEGIVEVSIKSYQVYVTKAELFYWDALMPSVLNVLLEELDENTLFEKVGSRSTASQVGNVGNDFLGF